jgi:hypothetical protein
MVRVELRLALIVGVQPFVELAPFRSGRAAKGRIDARPRLGLVPRARVFDSVPGRIRLRCSLTFGEVEKGIEVCMVGAELTGADEAKVV